MGRRHKAKTGGTGKALEILENKQNKKLSTTSRRGPEDDESDQNEEDYVDDRGNMLLDKKVLDSDEEEDEEIFNLDADDDEDEEEEEVEDDYDDEDEDEIDGDLGELIKNLDPKLKNKVLNKTAVDDSDDEELITKTKLKGLNKFGQNKRDYYDGDTADLEIGEDFEDAEEEEEAAKEIVKEKLSRMKVSDFFDAVDENLDDDDDVLAFIKKHSTKSGKKHDKLMGDLELIALGAGGQTNVQVEDMHRDFTKLSTDQKVSAIKSESPEVESILRDLKEKTLELKDKIAPLRQLVQQVKDLGAIDDDIVEYLQLKHQLLLSYCMNVVFYLYMKTLGLSVRNHPVMRQLLELRYVMEKMRPIDGKLKYQIDRLLKLKSLDADEVKTALLRPNLQSLMDDDDGEDGGYEEMKQTSIRSKKNKQSKSIRKKGKEDYDSLEDESIASSEVDGHMRDDNLDEEEVDDGDDDDFLDKKSKKKSGDVYKPPKLAAMPYEDEERLAEKRERKLEMKRKKLRNSEILESLREEFGNNPELQSSTGIGVENAAEKDIEDEEEERKNFEEDRFIRLTMTRQEKQSMKRKRQEAGRLDNLDSIGDIGEFDELVDLAKKSNTAIGTASKAKATAFGDDSDMKDELVPKALSSAMQRTINSLSQKQTKQRDSSRSKIDSDEVLFEVKSKSSRRPAPMDSMEQAAGFDDDEGQPTNKGKRSDNIEDDFDEDNLLEAFTKKKREFLSRKKAHYTAEPRYGGYEEDVDDGDKRAATYEMITNKGLTPHRNKANRNARVKKRVKYDKALIRRKGAVQTVRTGEAAAYGGERTGIKANVSRSRKF